MSLSILVVDDEAAARERLIRMIADLDAQVVGEASNGLEALEAAERLRPDVVLLDIQMPEVSGLDVARRLSEPRPLVIFQTAYGEYALDAFDREALDYLLKPISRERLSQALTRARTRLAERGAITRVTSEMAARLEASLAGAMRPRPRRLLVRHQAGHRLLPVSEIDRFVAEDGLIYACAGSVRHGTDDSLDDLERRLAGAFVRANRSELIAIDRVDRVTAGGDGALVLTLRDGAGVRVSRRRAASVRAALQL